MDVNESVFGSVELVSLLFVVLFLSPFLFVGWLSDKVEEKVVFDSYDECYG